MTTDHGSTNIVAYSDVDTDAESIGGTSSVEDKDRADTGAGTGTGSGTGSSASNDNPDPDLDRCHDHDDLHQGGTSALNTTEGTRQLWHQLASLAKTLNISSVSFRCLKQVLWTAGDDYEVLAQLTDCCNTFESSNDIVDLTITRDDSKMEQIPGIHQSLEHMHRIRQFLESTKDIDKAHTMQLHLARIHYNINEYNKSLAIIENTHQDMKHPETMFLKCLNHLKLQQFQQITHILPYIETSDLPPHSQINYLKFLVKYYFHQGHHTEAVSTLSKLEFIDKFTAFNYKYQILVALNENRLNDAVYYSNQAVTFFPTHYDHLVLNSFVHHISNAHYSNSLSKHILQYYQQPKYDFLPFFLQGWSHLKNKQYQQSFETIQTCFTKSSKIALVWLVVGNLYLNLGQLPDSLSAFSQALRLQIDEVSLTSALAWDGLSCVYERCDGQKSDAIDAAHRSMEIFTALGLQPESSILLQFIDSLKASETESSEIHRPAIEIPDSLVLQYLNMEAVDRMLLSDDFHHRKSEPAATPSSVQQQPQIIAPYRPAYAGPPSGVASRVYGQQFHPQLSASPAPVPMPVPGYVPGPGPGPGPPGAPMAYHPYHSPFAANPQVAQIPQYYGQPKYPTQRPGPYYGYYYP